LDIGEKVSKENPCLSVFLLLRIGLIYVLFQVLIKRIEINRAPKEDKGEFHKKADEKAMSYIIGEVISRGNPC
jgi:hypothetical protein